MTARFAAAPLAFLGLSLSASSTPAQSSVFAGRVLSDSGLVLHGAAVVIAALQRSIRTNEKGEFQFTAVQTGEHIVSVRMPGYAPKIDTIEVADAGESRREYRLARVSASLPEVPVTATLGDRMLADFENRRRYGAGRFLDSTQFANSHGTRTSDRLARLSGLMISRGRNAAIVMSTRGRCPATIWVDGLNYGTGIDINMFDVNSIVAVEWYSSPATIPVQFHVSRIGIRNCAVLMLWTR
jgi:hypothetical protein